MVGAQLLGGDRSLATPLCPLLPLCRKLGSKEATESVNHILQSQEAEVGDILSPWQIHRSWLMFGLMGHKWQGLKWCQPSMRWHLIHISTPAPHRRHFSWVTGMAWHGCSYVKGKRSLGGGVAWKISNQSQEMN